MPTPQAGFQFGGYCTDSGFTNQTVIGPNFQYPLFDSSGNVWTAYNPAWSGPGVYQNSRLINCGNAALNLSTGEAVYLFIDPGVSATPQLGTSVDRASHAIVHGPLSGFNVPGTWQGMTLCRDKSDNLYVIGASSAGSHTSVAVQAFSHLNGANWAPVAVASAGSLGSLAWSAFASVWCDTGGGTGGAGHILVIASAGTHNAYWILDAGLAQAGTSSGLVVASGLDPTFLGTTVSAASGSNLDMSANSFGTTSGLAISADTTSLAGVGAWAVSSAGSLSTNTSLGTITTGTLGNFTRLRCLWCYSDVWTLAYPATNGQIGVVCSSSTTLQPSGTANYTSARGGFGVISGVVIPPGGSVQWDAISTGTEVWVISYNIVGPIPMANLLSTLGYTWTSGSPPATLHGGLNPGTVPPPYAGQDSVSLVALSFNVSNPTNPVAGTFASSTPIQVWTGKDWTGPQSTELQILSSAILAPNNNYTVTYNPASYQIAYQGIRSVPNPFNAAVSDVWWWMQGTYANEIIIGAAFLTDTLALYNATEAWVLYLGSGMGQALALPQPAPAPAPPTFAAVLLTPADDSSAYLAGGATFTWSFSSTLAGDSQTAFYFQRTHAATVEYWTGSAWSSTPTQITSATSSVVFPAAQWATSVTYTWTVQVVNSQSLLSGYATPFTVSSAPAVPTAPTLTAAAVPANNTVTLTATSTYNAAGLLLIEASADTVTWVPVRAANGVAIGALGTVTVIDYEAPPDAARFYRAKVADATWMAYGPPSTQQTVFVPAITTYWLRQPTALNVGIQPSVKAGTFVTTITESVTVHTALGRQYPVPISDVLHGEDGGLTFLTQSDTDTAALRVLLLSQQTLLLQTPEQTQYYIRVMVPELSKGLLAASLIYTNLKTDRPDPGMQNRYRELPITFVNVGMP